MKAPGIVMAEKRAFMAEVFEPFLTPATSAVFDPVEFRIKELYISERAGVQTFSDAFFNEMFPPLAAPAELYHYTKMSTLKSIASSCTLRLYSMEKRIHEGELRDFARDHDLKGYLDTSEGEPYYKELGHDLFYTSLTRDFSNEAYCWGAFADGGRGVRLKLRLSPRYGDLRPIQYAQPSRTTLKHLNEALKAKKLPPFVPWTLSRIGGFYLQTTLAVENEVRLLAKRHLCATSHTASDGQYEYWPIPIGQDSRVCRVDVLEIAAGAGAKPNELEAAVANTCLANVPFIVRGDH